MGEKKVTKMIIRGDLQCYKCYKKIKKILCEIPQIQDQVYDEKNNKVTIVVVCCSPEKIQELICFKGCGCIESIEIVEEKPPKQTPEPKGCKEPPSPPPAQPDPSPTCQAIIPVPTPTPKPKPPPAPKPILVPMPVPRCPPVFYPVMWYPCYVGCRGPCSHGRLPMCPDGCGRLAHECMCPDGCGRPARECMPAREFMCPDGCGRLARECMCPDGCGRPARECMPAHEFMCLDGCGRLARECMCPDGCGRRARDCMCPDGCGRLARECMCPDGCGRLVNQCHGSNRVYSVNRCDYFSEENANACTIM